MSAVLTMKCSVPGTVDHVSAALLARKICESLSVALRWRVWIKWLRLFLGSGKTVAYMIGVVHRLSQQLLSYELLP